MNVMGFAQWCIKMDIRLQLNTVCFLSLLNSDKLELAECRLIQNFIDPRKRKLCIICICLSLTFLHGTFLDGSEFYF